jgi:hypothetical protein
MRPGCPATKGVIRSGTLSTGRAESGGGKGRGEGGGCEGWGKGGGRRTCSFALVDVKSLSPLFTHSASASDRKTLPSWVSRS